MLENIGRLPQVEAAGVTDSLPLRNGSAWSLTVEGRPPNRPGQYEVIGVSRVSLGYFGAMGVRLLRGRGPRETDAAGAPLVAAISETMARR